MYEPSGVAPTGVPRSQRTPPPQDPAVGLYLGSYGGPGEGVFFYERGTPVRGYLPTSLRGSRLRSCMLATGALPTRLPSPPKREATHSVDWLIYILLSHVYESSHFDASLSTQTARPFVSEYRVRSAGSRAAGQKGAVVIAFCSPCSSLILEASRPNQIAWRLHRNILWAVRWNVPTK